MQNKKKKIKLKLYDVVVTKSGFELYSGEIHQFYYSSKKGIFVNFTSSLMFKEKGQYAHLRTIKEKETYWSNVSTNITDKLKHIKRPTCKLRPIS